MEGRGQLPEQWKSLWTDVEVGHGAAGLCLRRPAQVLVSARDVERAAALLKGWKPERGGGDGSPDEPVRFRSSAGHPVDIEDTLGTLADAGLQATPVHVFSGAGPITYTGAPRYQGGPGTLVHPAAPPEDAPELGRGDGEGVRVVVLDTGLVPDNEWLAAHCPIDATDPDIDSCDADGDQFLDPQSGHGTFVAGIVLQVAPGARVEVIKVLASNGLCDEVELHQGLKRVPPDAQVINLSLGGYTADDKPPMGLQSQLKRLQRGGAVIVSAAGNDGSSRPFWPAALDNVIGVGAVDVRGLMPDWSNSGPWVDATAPGVDLRSAFVRFETKVQPGGGTVQFDRWARWSGTSFAAPLLAGAIAVAIARDGANPQDAVQSILNGCCSPGSAPPQLDLVALGAIKDVALPSGIVG